MGFLLGIGASTLPGDIQQSMLEKSRTSPLVSVIVPVFNGEQFLSRCLDSIFAQTMPDFEVLVVNDGSTDGTASILADYAARHQQLVVLEQANAGQGAARNRALDLARGEFVLFVDADDFIERVTLQVTTERALEDESDLVHFDWKFIRPKPDHLGKYDYYNIEPFWHQRMLEGAECEQLFRMHSYFSVTNLYRRSFLERHDLRYEEGQIYEDNPFLARVFSLVERVSLVHSPLYIIQASPNSSTKSGTDTPRHMRDHLSAVRKSFATISPRTPATLGDLAEYHLEKFSTYYGRRVPKHLRADYAREFVEILAAQDLQFTTFGRKTSWLTKACLNLRVFEDDKPQTLQRLIAWKDFATPPAKKLVSAGKKTKRRLRHPLRTINTVVSGRSPEVAPGTILFLGFDYRYTGNSRALFEELLADERFRDRDIRFATTDARVPSRHRIRPESIAFTRAAERSELVIAETWVPASVPKSAGSTWVQLWHGTPIKRMLFDSHEREITKARPAHKVNKYKDIQRWDYFVVDGELAAERFSTAFLLTPERLLVSEYPRVTQMKLFENGTRSLPELETTRLSSDSRVLLYAPTWRDKLYGIRSRNGPQDSQTDLAAIADALGEPWVILAKNHPYLLQTGLVRHPRVLWVDNVDISDLLPAASIVVSDFSSMMFDASALGIPILRIIHDRHGFDQSRGTYLGGAPWPEISSDEDAEHIALRIHRMLKWDNGEIIPLEQSRHLASLADQLHQVQELIR
ncbi:CDP-glycerol glycerophosphotransferase family protein [Leucobacter sp. NPDC015123]|uniref:bifunctional glycosyltransferase/CDP-glycerol:glycerophosphate glycerophosphotransferase n=1 Tax=Leucobacter sp. NPDC015123 TaxID=3364129 RepID=UPI0036F47867